MTSVSERRAVAIEEAVSLLAPSPAERAACRQKVEAAVDGLAYVFEHRADIEGGATGAEMRDELYALDAASRRVRAAFANLSSRSERFFSDEDRALIVRLNDLGNRAGSYAAGFKVTRHIKRPPLIATIAAKQAAVLLESSGRTLSAGLNADALEALADALIQAVTDETIATANACLNELHRLSTAMGDKV